MSHVQYTWSSINTRPSMWSVRDSSNESYKKSIYTRPSILCVTHQMSPIKGEIIQLAELCLTR